MADGVALRLNQVEYTAADERLMAALGLMPDAGSGLAVREGRRLGPGLEVTVSADGLSAVVQPGLAVVQHALAAGGDYHVAFPAVVNKALAAKPGAGQKRRDTVVVDVLDADVTQKPTALREANIAVLTGTATSGTPTAPPAGAMQFEIGQVAFDGTNTPTIHPTNPRYTWAAGGIGVVHSAAERDGLGAYDGLVVYRDDTGGFEARVDGAWSSLKPSPVEVRVSNNGTTRAPGFTGVVVFDNTEKMVGATKSGQKIFLPAGTYEMEHVAMCGGATSGFGRISIRKNSNGSPSGGQLVVEGFVGFVSGAVHPLRAHKGLVDIADGDYVEGFVGNDNQSDQALTVPSPTYAVPARDYHYLTIRRVS